MTIKAIEPKKFVIEVRMKPRLRFYSLCNSVGDELMTEEYSDWARGPLFVDIQDRVNHRHVGLHHNRIYFEAEGSVPESVARDGLRMVIKACDGLEVTEAIRLGVRSWFAIEISGNLTERGLIASLVRKLSPREALEEIVGDGFQFDDVAYTFEFMSPNKKERCRVVVGAMERKQWLQHAPYAEGGRQQHIDQRGVEGIVESLPNAFLYIDLDLARVEDSLRVSEIETKAEAFSRKANSIVRNLIAKMQRG